MYNREAVMQGLDDLRKKKKDYLEEFFKIAVEVMVVHSRSQYRFNVNDVEVPIRIIRTECNERDFILEEHQTEKGYFIISI